MPLEPGTRLGPYEIVAPLGAGGMGEVYRARDTRLGREVAVKVLPGDVASDPERLRRFEQEAKAASALNHPAILTVHDFGTHDGVAYLVTELLVGESLRETLRRGPLPPRRALEIAIQVARGLAAAHEKGIVHRDLKPENLFLIKDGAAKILDFGLARVERPEPTLTELHDASTLLETQAGTVLGTAGYMAPEQVRGERADARSDLFALGVVLHEMIAGANPFRRDSTIESLNAILKEEPSDLGAAATGAPPALASLVARLLEKEPGRRFHSAADLAFALEALSGTASGAGVASSATTTRVRSRRFWQLPLAGLAVLAVGFVVGALVRPTPKPAKPRPVRFEVAPIAGGFPGSAETHNLALSPDGRTLAVVVAEGGRWTLHLRDIDRVESKPLAGTEGAYSPFWAPDGASIAFFAGGKLKRIARDGGPVQTICDVQGSNTGSWGADGTILFSQGFGPNNGLFRVTAGGGTPVAVATPGGGNLPRWMEFLPDGRHFLYWDRKTDGITGQTYFVDLVSGSWSALPGVVSRARYAPPGWLVYANGPTLVAQRFDAASGRLSGEPHPLASEVPFFFNGWASFAVGGPGTIAYQVRPAPTALGWFDRRGRELGRTGPAAAYLAVRLSPDGTQAAVTRSDPETAFTDVWIIDLARGGTTRLTDEPLLDWSPAWSPEGDRIAYTTVLPGPRFTVTFRRVADGTKIGSLPPHGNFVWPRSWSPRGIFLDRLAGSGWDLYRSPSPDQDAAPVLATEFDEQYPSPSPDGRWIAFRTRESGNGEIEMLRPETPGRRIRVSRGAATAVPRWRGDGGELYYVSADGWLSAVTVGPGDSPALGAPEPLFPVDLYGEDSFDVSRDGQRFLLAGTRTTSSLPITVVLDWQSELPDD